jgi:hypothetical protein
MTAKHILRLQVTESADATSDCLYGVKAAHPPVCARIASQQPRLDTKIWKWLVVITLMGMEFRRPVCHEWLTRREKDPNVGTIEMDPRWPDMSAHLQALGRVSLPVCGLSPRVNL